MSEQTFDEYVMTLPDSHCRCKGCPGLHGGCPCCRGMVGPELPDDLYESPSEYECEQEKIAEAFAAAAPKPVTHTMVEVSLLDQANATIATQAAELAAAQQRIAELEIEAGLTRGPGCISGCDWWDDGKFHHHAYCNRFGDSNGPIKFAGKSWMEESSFNMESARLQRAETERDEARAQAERYRAALVYRCDLYTQCLVCHNMLTWSEAERWNGPEPLGHTDYCPVGPIMDATPPPRRQGAMRSNGCRIARGTE